MEEWFHIPVLIGHCQGGAGGAGGVPVVPAMRQFLLTNLVRAEAIETLGSYVLAKLSFIKRAKRVGAQYLLIFPPTPALHHTPPSPPLPIYLIINRRKVTHSDAM